MTKVLLMFLGVTITLSCNTGNKEPEIDFTGFSQKKIALTGFNKEYERTDTLGSILLKIPQRFDTFYQWHRTTDYLAGDWLQYRYADKKYPQFAESGFFWTTVPDSVYQITIRHNPVSITPNSIKMRQLTQNDTAIDWLSQSSNLCYDKVKFLEKNFISIGKRSFLIFSFITPNGYLTNKQTLFVTAATILKNRELYFIGECGTKDTAGFIDDMHKSILSIKIVEK